MSAYLAFEQPAFRLHPTPLATSPQPSAKLSAGTGEAKYASYSSTRPRLDCHRSDRLVCHVRKFPTATGRSFTLSNSAWKVFIPSTYYQRPGNVADVLVHFHGEPQTYWNNAKYANLNAIIVTVELQWPLERVLDAIFELRAFQQVVDEVTHQSSCRSPISPTTLQWDKLAVSSFSAGYGCGSRDSQERDLSRRHRRPTRCRFALRHTSPPMERHSIRKWSTTKPSPI